MDEPIPNAELDAMLARAGIHLPPREMADVRSAHPKLLALQLALRDPLPELPDEPAFTFRLEERP